MSVLCAWDHTVCAQPRSNAAAHEAFVQGQKAFKSAQYEAALQQFKDSYAMSGRAEILLPLAQTYRKLGRFDEALSTCDQFLATHPTPARERSTYEFMGQLRAEKKEAAEQQPAASQVTPPPAPPPLQLSAPPPSSAPAALVTQPSDERRAKKRKIAIAIGVTAAIVVVGVGLGVGLALGLPRQDSYPGSALGGVSFK